MKSKENIVSSSEPQNMDQPTEFGGSDSISNDAFLERIYGRNSGWFIGAVLLFGCVLIYFQVAGFEYINFDDNNYVYGNPKVSGGLTWENVKWSFTAFHSANWHPLTWLSHQLDSTLFGGNAGYHHLTNAFFHAMNSVLLFFTVRKLTGATWKSGLVAAVFAFHPAHVESVAWVSERKDVLSTLFLILTIWFYADFARGKRRTRNYILVILCFALGLTAKPMLVTLPFVLLLLDYWPLRRFEQLRWHNLAPLVVEKLPLFALTMASSVITYYAQKSGGAVMALESLPLTSRMINALLSYARYTAMLFYPVNLGGWYPYPVEGFPLWQIVGASLLFFLVSAAAIRYAYQRKYLLTGWLWFLGTLVPVIGLMQVGRQSHADRYTYVPYIGLSLAVIWLAAAWIEKAKLNKDAVSAVVILLLVIMGILSFWQVSHWRNNETFYKHTLAVTEKNFLFEQNYCQYLLEANRLEEAETQCRNSIENSPSPYPNSFLSYGLIEMKKKNYEAALGNFEIASRLRPHDIVAFSNYINALIALERLDDAAEKTKLMKESDISDNLKTPYLFPLYSQLSFGFAHKGETEKAIAHARNALAIDGTNADQHANLGLLLYKDGRKDEALSEITEALRLKPMQADLQVAVGHIHLDQGRYDKAGAHFRKALEIDPNMTAAREYLDKLPSAK